MTGLDQTAEIIEIAVIDRHGATLVDQRIRQLQPIPAAPTAIHGLRDADVPAAPLWSAVWPQITALLRGKLIACFNRNFDQRMLRHNAARCGSSLMPTRWLCISELYAQLTNSPHWRSLVTANAALGLPVRPVHCARGDALVALAAAQSLAAPPVRALLLVEHS